MEKTDLLESRKEARQRGKADYLAWTMARQTGEDPVAMERRWAEKGEVDALAYSVYVRYDAAETNVAEEPVVDDQDEKRFAKLTNGQFKTLSQQIDKGFTANEHQFKQLNAHIDRLENRMDGVEHEMKSVQSEMKGVQGEMKGVKRVVNQHSVEILELKAEVMPA